MPSLAAPVNGALAPDSAAPATPLAAVRTAFLPRWSRWLGWGLLIAWALFIGYVTERSLATLPTRSGATLPRELLSWLALGTILPDTLLIGAAFVLAGRWPLEPGRWSRRLWVHLAAPLVATALDHAMEGVVAHWLVEVRPSLLSELLNCALFYALPSAFAHALQFAEQARQQQVRSLLLHAELAEAEGRRTRAELRALRVDLNPNLLFDTLDTIARLIRRDAAAANRVLVRLSELLRHLLSGAGTREVRLRDEIEALRLYVELRRAAEGEEVELECGAEDDAAATRVPHLLLRSLLEVAAAGGAPEIPGMSRSIAIHARLVEEGERLEIVVRYAGPAGAAREEAEGRVRARLERFYPDGFELATRRAEDGSSECAARLPVQPEAVARAEPGEGTASETAVPTPPLELRMPRVPLRLWALWFGAVWLFHAGGLRTSGNHGPLSPATTAGVLALIAALKWTLAFFLAARLTGRYPLGVPFRWRIARLHALAALGYGIFALCTRLLADYALGTRSPVHQPGIAVGAVLMNAVIFALFVGAAHTALYAHAVGARTIAELRLRRILAQAELDRTQAEMRALKMELNPHFLFNALNSISSLLYTDVEAAEHMVERLSELLRRALAQVDTQCVPLRDELELLRLYLEIEQTRFGERLSVEWAVDPEVLDAEVPHLVLQPLVENAIKHAIAPLRTPGHMRIAARAEGERLFLEVRDNGPGLADAAPADGGIGLANTRARLTRLYQGTHRFELYSAEGGGVVAGVTIPLRVLDASELAASP